MYLFKIKKRGRRVSARPRFNLLKWQEREPRDLAEREKHGRLPERVGRGRDGGIKSRG
jgi:hypothetical protein